MLRNSFEVQVNVIVESKYLMMMYVPSEDPLYRNIWFEYSTFEQYTLRCAHINKRRGGCIW